MSSGTEAPEAWGTEIETTVVRGIPYRQYSQRPRRVESLLRSAHRWGNRPHLIQGRAELTFADLITAAEAKAAELRALGLASGDRVVLLGWNSPQWVTNFWAVLLSGGVPVLANAWWSDAELEGALDLVTPRLVLADAAGAKKLNGTWPLGNWGPVEAHDDEIKEIAQSDDEEAPAAVIFTSGTSGKPKAVLLSHRSLLAGLHQLLHVSRRLPQQVDESSGDVGLHTGPLFHIGGIQTLLRSVVVGGTLVMPAGRFDAGEVLELVEKYKISRWSAVPTMVSRVLDHPDLATRDVSSLRSITVGGAPVHADFLARISEALPVAGARVPTGYGLTENGGQATAASGRDEADRTGASGKPLPCVEVSFFAHEGLPDGEILLRSPTQMTEYLGDAESPIDKEGWLHTGDLGFLDDEGHLWITGRSKDVIIRGGENIAPVAVERALMAIPSVVEVAVVGVPHPDLGEEVMAFVVVDSDSVTTDDLAAGLRGNIASFAIPSRWQIGMEPLPTNHTHKVDKNALSVLGAEIASVDR